MVPLTVSIVRGDTVAALDIPLGQISARVFVRVDHNVLRQVDPSIPAPTMTKPFGGSRPAVDRVHLSVSTAVFGAEVARSPVLMAWPKRMPPITVQYGYIGFYYDYNVPLVDLAPRVLQLTSTEALQDGHVIVFNLEESYGPDKSQFNEMAHGISRREAVEPAA